MIEFIRNKWVDFQIWLGFHAYAHGWVRIMSAVPRWFQRRKYGSVGIPSVSTMEELRDSIPGYVWTPDGPWDWWQIPQATLVTGKGDCEDRQETLKAIYKNSSFLGRYGSAYALSVFWRPVSNWIVDGHTVLLLLDASGSKPVYRWMDYGLPSPAFDSLHAVLNDVSQKYNRVDDGFWAIHNTELDPMSFGRGKWIP